MRAPHWLPDPTSERAHTPSLANNIPKATSFPYGYDHFVMHGAGSFHLAASRGRPSVGFQAGVIEMRA